VLDGGAVRKTATWVVEHASEVLERITEDEGDFQRRIGDLSGVKRHQLGLIVVFSPDGARVLLPEQNQVGVEIIDVLLGPLILRRYLGVGFWVLYRHNQFTIHVL
jgi:hypothetical protein